MALEGTKGEKRGGKALGKKRTGVCSQEERFCPTNEEGSRISKVRESTHHNNASDEIAS